MKLEHSGNQHGWFFCLFISCPTRAKFALFILTQLLNLSSWEHAQSFSSFVATGCDSWFTPLPVGSPFSSWTSRAHSVDVTHGFKSPWYIKSTHQTRNEKEWGWDTEDYAEDDTKAGKSLRIAEDGERDDIKHLNRRKKQDGDRQIRAETNQDIITDGKEKPKGNEEKRDQNFFSEARVASRKQSFSNSLTWESCAQRFCWADAAFSVQTW